MNLSLTPMLCISAVLGEKKRVSVKKIQYEVLPRHFHEQIREDFLSFIIRYSFVLWSSTGKCLNLRLSIHFLFCLLSSSSSSLSIFFSSAFNELFTVYLSPYLA